MTAQEIIAGNKLILNSPFVKNKSILNLVKELSIQNYSETYIYVEKLDFHSNFSRLIVVLEEINATGIYDAIIYKTTCHINDKLQIITEACGNNMLEATYKAVVNFLNWYNKQPK